MTLFLLGYAIGLKEKIKKIMRGVLVTISMFVIFTTVQGSVSAEDLTAEQPEISPVESFLERLFYIQPSWSTSPVYDLGNKMFFEGLRDQFSLIPAQEHLKMLGYTIQMFESMSTHEARKTYKIQKDIVVAILQGIYEMAEDEKYAIFRDEDEAHSSCSAEDMLYTREMLTHNGKDFVIFTLNTPDTIKYANFHNEKGNMHQCMYNQCNKLAFEASMMPTEIHLFWNHWEKDNTTSEIITFGASVNECDYTYSDSLAEDEDDDMNNTLSNLLEELKKNENITSVAINDNQITLHGTVNGLKDIYGEEGIIDFFSAYPFIQFFKLPYFRADNEIGGYEYILIADVLI